MMHYFGAIKFCGAAEKCVVNFCWGHKLLGNSWRRQYLSEVLKNK